jgi:hypothetical protein
MPYDITVLYDRVPRFFQKAATFEKIEALFEKNEALFEKIEALFEKIEALFEKIEALFEKKAFTTIKMAPSFPKSFTFLLTPAHSLAPHEWS